jgi:hypothetical protein
MSVRTRLFSLASAVASGADRESGSTGSDPRATNEGIAAVGRSFAVPARLRFRCECGHDECAETIALGVGEYESIRSGGGSVVAAVPGH